MKMTIDDDEIHALRIPREIEDIYADPEFEAQIPVTPQRLRHHHQWLAVLDDREGINHLLYPEENAGHSLQPCKKLGGPKYFDQET